MKTFFEIVENKNYRQLTNEEKQAIQDRQDQLVIAWQDESNGMRKEEIFDELYASVTGLIKGMSYKQAEKSFSVEQEDFEGIMNLTLVESLIAYDRTLGKPFQPVFIYNVKNEIKMMYRSKGYDVHDTVLDRLEQPNEQDSSTTLADIATESESFTEGIEWNMVTEQVLSSMFGTDEVKKTMVNMFLEGFKRNEIVSAVKEQGKSTESVARKVNRTLSEFKAQYSNLLSVN